MLTPQRIEELASGKNVKRIAVENFLMTLDGMTYMEAKMNLEMDAQSYRWNYETIGAIGVGLTEAYVGGP